MQRECVSGHPIEFRGLLRLSWCVECGRFELHAWAASASKDPVVNLLPEWAAVVLLPDDEYLQRTLTKYATGLAQSVRLMAEDDAAGRLRLL